ncbi:MAG: MBL fold metallo-hydrolase [Leptospirales bacterium]
MKFTALPVNVGDSFLIRTENYVVLVDGGMNKQHILKLLRQEKIPNNHIDLLICTHYDADHINGIIGILKSQKYSFKELWLPEILGSIGYTLSKNIGELFGDPRNYNFSIEKYQTNSHSVFDRYESEEINEVSSSNNSFEKIDNDVLSGIGKAFFPWYDELFWNFNKINTTSQYKMISSAKSVASLVSNSLSSGAYIRWFKYQNKETHKTYGFNMYCENSLQTDITLFDRELFFLALYEISLSKINKYSLVYMHRKDEIPDVLFTADSDLNFYSNKVALKNNSIITSPHHGSSANDLAYAKITGANLTYVRSDRSQQNRPGKGYLNNQNKFCTICRNITQKQKIEFDFNGTIFTTSARVCNC